MSTITVEPTREATTTVTKRDVFIRAADILEEFGWHQHDMVRDACGRKLGHFVMVSAAASFCLWGAIARAAIELGAMPNDQFGSYESPAWNALRSTPGANGASWNDERDRTKEEVVQHLRQLAVSNYATLS